MHEAVCWRLWWKSHQGSGWKKRSAKSAERASPVEIDVGALIGGGKLTYGALQNLDLPVVMAAVLCASFFVVPANALVDAVQAALDPRQR